jgi:hypothetical protein
LLHVPCVLIVQNTAAYLGACCGQPAATFGKNALMQKQPPAVGSKGACKSDAASSDKSAGGVIAGMQHQKADAARTATTADTLTNQRVSSEGINSSQQPQQQLSSGGAVWQLSTPAQQQQQQVKNPDHLVKMLFAAALQNGVCKPQQQAGQQQASFSTGSLMSPAVSSLQTPAAAAAAAYMQQAAQLQLLQQRQQAASTPALAVSRGMAVPASLSQPALVALQQRPPIMLALAPIHTRLPLAAAGLASNPQQQLPQQQPAQQEKPQQLQDQHLSSPRAMHAALGDRAFYSIRSLLLAQQDMFVQQLFELHRLARAQNMAWAEVMPAATNSPSTAAEGAATDAEVNSQAGKHQQMTRQYGADALAAVRSASARSKASSVSASQQQQAEAPAAPVTAFAAAANVSPVAAAKRSGAPSRSSSWRVPTPAAPQQDVAPQADAPFAVTDRAALAADDIGAAEVADLPVHLVLLANVPSTMRKAVSQPDVSDDYSRLNPAKYYACRGPGILRPTPMRYMADAAAAAGAAIADCILDGSSARGGPLAALAAATAAAAAVAAAGEECAEPTVQPGMQPGMYGDMYGSQELAAALVAAAAAVAAPVAQQQQQQEGLPQQQRKRPPQRSHTVRSLAPNKRPAVSAAAAAADMAAAAAAAAAYQGGVFDDQEIQQPQAMQMPPPPPLLPELAAQHFAAAAAQHQLMQQQQRRYEDEYMRQQQAAAAAQEFEMQQGEDELDAAALAAAQPAGGLNVFRPMPQIDPSFASRFLAGGSGALEGARQAAGAGSQFDPHQYWMKKHYGAAAAAAVPAPQQQQWPQQQQQGYLDGAAAAAAGYDMYGAGSAGCGQEQYSDACGSGLANMAAAAAAASAGGMAGGSQQSGGPLVHWWQDAKATFGDIGLIDPDSMPAQTSSRGNSRWVVLC